MFDKAIFKSSFTTESSGMVPIQRRINVMNDSVVVYGVKDACLQPVKYARPESPPRDCGFSNEDLECMGCGTKLGCVVPGHCYLVEGEDALKK